MKRVFGLCALTACMSASLSSTLAQAGEVIAHPSVTLSWAEVRDLYLGERQFAGAVKLVPTDNGVLLSDFLAKVVQTDERTYAARWRRKAYRHGLAAPKLLGSDADVHAFVKATPGAVGYVNATKGAGVKVLDKF